MPSSDPATVYRALTVEPSPELDGFADLIRVLDAVGELMAVDAVRPPAIGIDDDRRAARPDEPLVPADEILHCCNAYRRAGWPGTTEQVWLRPGVLDRLLAARAALPEGFGFAIFDGWRSSETITALYRHYYGPDSTLEPGFLADPEDRTTIPPHLTGGAVDLTLTWDGAPLALGTPFDEFSNRAHLEYFERSTPDDSSATASQQLVRGLRRLLTHTLTSHGFAPYWAEWWHVSFGDEAWARWSGTGVARYGPTAPEEDRR